MKKVLVAFNCGHGIIPNMAKILDEDRFHVIYVINKNQDDKPFPKDRVKKINNIIPDYPDTDIRRSYALNFAITFKFDKVVIMDDNIVMNVEDLWYMIQNTDDGMVSGAVRKNSNRHKGYERHPDFPASLYPNKSNGTHVYDTRGIETILRNEKDNPIVPLGLSSIYKLQIFSGVIKNIKNFKKLLPYGGFEPWQDMWLLVWAYYLRVPVRIFYNKYYERVNYKTEKKEHRVRGRCCQTNLQYLIRIKPKTKDWPLDLLHFGLTFIQHRGTEYYLKWDYGEKEMFKMSIISEKILKIKPESVPFAVFEWWNKRYESGDLPYSLHEYRKDKTMRDAWESGLIPKGTIPKRNPLKENYLRNLQDKLTKMNKIKISEEQWIVLNNELKNFKL